MIMVDRIELRGVFPSRIPSSARCLEYNLNILKQDSSPLLFDTLNIVYRDFSQEVEVNLRKTFLEFVIQQIKTVNHDPIVLLVLVHFDPHPDVVRLAVWAYLKHRKSTLDDPFVATQDILSIMVNRNVVNRGAAFAGLVCFGDRRVCSAATAIRDSISVEQARDFSAAVSSPLHRATVEFCLTWLLDLTKRNKHDTLVHVASAFATMVVDNSSQCILDTEFNFGPYGFTSNQTLPEIRFSDLLIELQPTLDLLAAYEISALDKMITILKDPPYRTPGEHYRRKVSTRRVSEFQRRSSDRRL